MATLLGEAHILGLQRRGSCQSSGLLLREAFPQRREGLRVPGPRGVPRLLGQRVPAYPLPAVRAPAQHRLEAVHLGALHEGKGVSGAARACRAAHAVDVGLEMGGCAVVDHSTDLWDVDAAGHHVRAYQAAHLGLAELPQQRGALSLREVRGELGDGAGFPQSLGHVNPRQQPMRSLRTAAITSFTVLGCGITFLAILLIALGGNCLLSLAAAALVLGTLVAPLQHGANLQQSG
mmetsp:Transcript_61953/g.175197  ORF Transcript_61953/g.175197 Transcript_61953/m.175197 type:complete len:234 (-) Transcript_61953:782-1483(-)